MAKHKYDLTIGAARKAAKTKVKAETQKKTTIKDLADRLADIEVAMGIRV